MEGNLNSKSDMDNYSILTDEIIEEVKAWLKDLDELTLVDSLNYAKLLITGTNDERRARLLRFMLSDYAEEDFVPCRAKVPLKDLLANRESILQTLAAAASLPDNVRTSLHQHMIQHGTNLLTLEIARHVQPQGQSSPQHAGIPENSDMSLTSTADATPVTSTATTTTTTLTTTTMSQSEYNGASQIRQTPEVKFVEYMFNDIKLTVPEFLASYLDEAAANKLQLQFLEKQLEESYIRKCEELHQQYQTTLKQTVQEQVQAAVQEERQRLRAQERNLKMREALLQPHDALSNLPNETENRRMVNFKETNEVIISTSVQTAAASASASDVPIAIGVSNLNPYAPAYTHYGIRDPQSTAPRIPMMRSTPTTNPFFNTMPNAALPTFSTLTSQQNVPAAHPDEQAFPLQQTSGGGGYLPSSTRVSSAIAQPHHSADSRTDIGKIVRGWRLQFPGEKAKKTSIEEFITRVEECRKLTPYLTDQDVLNAMTELLTGVALHWCRASRQNWHTWADFCQDARACYGVDRQLQQRLISEAQARTQGQGESVRDYIFCVLTILKKLEEPMSLEKQVDLLHRNMLPELRKLVPRTAVHNIAALVTQTREAEDLLDSERKFKPPPPPDLSIFPELAYSPTALEQDDMGLAAIALSDSRSSSSESIDSFHSKNNYGSA